MKNPTLYHEKEPCECVYGVDEHGMPDWLVPTKTCKLCAGTGLMLMAYRRHEKYPDIMTGTPVPFDDQFDNPDGHPG